MRLKGGPEVSELQKMPGLLTTIKEDKERPEGEDKVLDILVVVVIWVSFPFAQAKNFGAILDDYFSHTLQRSLPTNLGGFTSKYILDATYFSFSPW